MLVLARKLGQSIRIPDLNITIRVLKTHGKRVHLGLEVPAGLRIMRKELTRDGATHRETCTSTQTEKNAALVVGT